MTDNTHATLRRLEDVNGFVVLDLPGADSADGVVRCAKKVLVDSTKALARSRSYSWALLERRISGASGAINATGDAVAEAITSFATALAPEVAAGSLTLAAGRGTTPEGLEALGEVVQPDPAGFAGGIVGAISAATDGDLTGTKIAVEHGGEDDTSLTAALESAGAEIVATGSDAWGADAEVLLFGSKPGVLEHERVASLAHRVLVPTAVMAFTPRALAVATQAHKVLLPDFLTTAGPLAVRSGQDPTERVYALTTDVLSREEGPVLGACLAAEEFLTQWCEELPFGRPIG
ncbi:MAG: hypothetical protein ACK5O2_02150 [Microthrixaceae bacterium]